MPTSLDLWVECRVCVRIGDSADTRCLARLPYPAGGGAGQVEIGHDGPVSEDVYSRSDEDSKGRRPRWVADRFQRTDSRPQLVATARFIRKLLPGDDRYGEPLTLGGDRVPERIGRLVSEAQAERPSAMRELGLGALQAWQALSEAQGRGRGNVDVAIVFTDVVGFSAWALEAGDEAALDLLRKVAAVEDAAIAEHRGSLVKRLGDGSMSVFSDAADAVRAAIGAQA